MSHFTDVTLQPCYTSPMLHFAHVTLHPCHISPMLHFTHVIFHPCHTSPMLHFTHVTLHPCYTSPVLHFTLVRLCQPVQSMRVKPFFIMECLTVVSHVHLASFSVQRYELTDLPHRGLCCRMQDHLCCEYSPVCSPKYDTIVYVVSTPLSARPGMTRSSML